ncbi:hypothetical protein M758_7G101500 [Ceratodon purpureus]|nr:hypothetical protein M758_7G101500 [Ceratodon purpureus]
MASPHRETLNLPLSLPLSPPSPLQFQLLLAAFLLKTSPLHASISASRIHLSLLRFKCETLNLASSLLPPIPSQILFTLQFPLSSPHSPPPGILPASRAFSAFHSLLRLKP